MYICMNNHRYSVLKYRCLHFEYTKVSTSMTIHRWHSLNQRSQLLPRKDGIHFLMIFVV